MFYIPMSYYNCKVYYSVEIVKWIYLLKRLSELNCKLTNINVKWFNHYLMVENLMCYLG